VTGYSGAVAEGRAAGFPLLTKPYRGDQLDRAIQELIGAPAARDTEAAPLAG